MITAADRTTTRPPGAEQLIRRAGVGRRLFPVERLEYWAANPRLPYSGEPPGRVRSRIEVRRDDLDGRPVYEVTPVRCGPIQGHVVYLHGGAYVLEFIPSLHWPAIARLANLLGRTVTVPIYPLAPEHSYREVFGFLLELYRRVLATHDPETVAVMGDSAGGGMALALCHAVRDAGLPPPTDAVLLCPWVHVALPHPDVAGLARSDVTFNVDDLRAAGLRYAGGDPVDTPLVSPAAGPLDGLPPLTIFSGTHDVLHPDTREFWDRAVAAGLDVDGYEQYAGRHLWMYLPGQAGARPVFDKIRDRLVSGG